MKKVSNHVFLIFSFVFTVYPSIWKYKSYHQLPLIEMEINLYFSLCQPLAVLIVGCPRENVKQINQAMTISFFDKQRRCFSLFKTKASLQI